MIKSQKFFYMEMILLKFITEKRRMFLTLAVFALLFVVLSASELLAYTEEERNQALIEINQELEKTKNDLNSAQGQLTQTQKELNEANRQLKNARGKSSQNNSEIKNLRNQVSSLKKERDSLKEEASSLKQRINNLETRIAELERTPSNQSLTPSHASYGGGWFPNAHCRIVAFEHKPGESTVRLKIQYRNSPEIDVLEAPFRVNPSNVQDRFFKIETLPTVLQVVMPPADRGVWTVNVDATDGYVAKFLDPHDIENSVLDLQSNYDGYGGKTFVSGEAFVILRPSGMTIRPPVY